MPIESIICGNELKVIPNSRRWTLQKVSTYVSYEKYGQYGFFPVTDGELFQKRPPEQLLAGEGNGLRTLSGNNADKAPMFVHQTIANESDFNYYIQNLFPIMNSTILSQVQSTYAIAATTPGPLLSTLGDSGLTALNQSEFEIEQQQRADNLYSETTIVCPSYWLASAFAPTSQSSNSGKEAWKHRYSDPPSQHRADSDAYLAINWQALGYGTLLTGFRTAVQMIWGRFIVYDDPTLPAGTIESITTLYDGTITGDDIAAAGVWPAWEVGNDSGEAGYQINMTGSHPTNLRHVRVGFSLFRHDKIVFY